MSRKTPVSAQAVVGAAVGAAACRSRPSSKPSKNSRQRSSTEAGSARHFWYAASRAPAFIRLAKDDIFMLYSIRLAGCESLLGGLAALPSTSGPLREIFAVQPVRKL